MGNARTRSCGTLGRRVYGIPTDVTCRRKIETRKSNVYFELRKFPLAEITEAPVGEPKKVHENEAQFPKSEVCTRTEATDDTHWEGGTNT